MSCNHKSRTTDCQLHKNDCLKRHTPTSVELKVLFYFKRHNGEKLLESENLFRILKQKKRRIGFTNCHWQCHLQFDSQLVQVVDWLVLILPNCKPSWVRCADAKCPSSILCSHDVIIHGGSNIRRDATGFWLDMRMLADDRSS